MDKSINYYELKSELSGTGFREPDVVDALRQAIFLNKNEERLTTHIGEVGFNLHFIRDDYDRLSFIGYSGSLGAGSDNWKLQSFHSGVPVEDAITLLKIRAEKMPQEEMLCLIPISKWETQEEIQLLNTNVMNTQNLEFLKKSLLNLGFGEKVNEQLEKNINKKVPEFNLTVQHEFNQKKVDYTLHFKAGENQEMYFFNKFDATLSKGKEKEMNQTFYINKGNGVTAKEAFNLMEGRAVHKQLFNKDGEKYQAWLQLDNDNLTQNGSKEIKKFNENYGFDMEDLLSGKGIKEMATAEGRDNLFRSLKKGNVQQITVEREGGEKKYFIAASPQYKTVDLFDHQQKKIKREELLNPEQKQDNSQKQNNNQKQEKQQKEELPEKKQSRKTRIHV
jgi:hypothetical protein